MNNANIFSENGWLIVESISKIPTISRGDFTGHVYALEYGDKIKIGMTTCPENRAKQLDSLGRNYGNVKTGRIAISMPHTNFSNNENMLHAHFAESRCVGSELFNITFEDFISNVPELEFKDETERLERETKEFTNSMKRIVLNGVGKESSMSTIEGVIPAFKYIYADAMINYKKSMSINEFVAVLAANGIDINVNLVMHIFRKEGYINSGIGTILNTPTDFSNNFGLFILTEKTRSLPQKIGGGLLIERILKLTPIGQTYFIAYFISRYRSNNAH